MISDYDWFLGSKATRPIAVLANKFKDLVKKDAKEHFGSDIKKYSPWLSAKYSRHLLKDISVTPPQINRGQLVCDRKILETLSKSFTQAGKHSVSAIVPKDIRVNIYTGNDLDLEKWNNVISDARKLLSEVAPWISNLCSEIVCCVIPIEHQKHGVPTKRGFSTPLCFGAFFLSLRDRTKNKGCEIVEMAIDLSHELGHHVLHTYQSSDKILISDLEEPIYSSVRRTNRPAIMSIHASAALSYMLEAAFALLESNKLTKPESNFAKDFIKTYYPEQKRGLLEIEEKCRFTEIGQYLFGEMKSQSNHFEEIFQRLNALSR